MDQAEVISTLLMVVAELAILAKKVALLYRLPGAAGDRRTCTRVCSRLAGGAARAGHGVSVFVAPNEVAAGETLRQVKDNVCRVSDPSP